MKGPAELTATVRRRLEAHWHTDLVGGTGTWPATLPLGRARSAELAARFSELTSEVAGLRSWAGDHGVEVIDEPRRVGPTVQQVPVRVVVPSIDVAAGVAGGEWTARLSRSRARLGVLTERFPAADAARVLRVFDVRSDADFELLVAAAEWFGDHDATGLTPRQVPVPGLHAKWLNAHRGVVEELCGHPLGLAAAHPARLHFTYLDPTHLAGGGRRFDVATVGDRSAPAYDVEVVLISENKDTAVNFPALPAAVAVEGAGFGGATAAAFGWLVDAPVVLYWGDLDAAGFEILDGYRAAGVPARSVLMDVATYERFAPWGSDTAVDGSPLVAQAPKPLVHLSASERAAYELVCDPPAGLPPRVEQERIPLEVAHAAVCDVLAAAGRGPLVSDGC